MKKLLTFLILSISTTAMAENTLWTCTGTSLQEPVVISGYYNDAETLLTASYQGQSGSIGSNDLEQTPLGLSTIYCANIGNKINVGIEIYESLNLPKGTAVGGLMSFISASRSGGCAKAYDAGMLKSAVTCVRGDSKAQYKLPVGTKGLEDVRLSRTYKLAEKEVVIDFQVQNGAPVIMTTMKKETNDITTNMRLYVENLSKDIVITTAQVHEFTSITRDPRGGYLLGFQTADAKKVPFAYFVKLKANGDRDPSFGQKGELSLVLGPQGNRSRKYPVITEAGEIFIPGEIYYLEKKETKRKANVTKMSSAGVVDESFRKNFEASFANGDYYFNFISGVAPDAKGNLIIYTTGHPYSGMAHTLLSIKRLLPMGSVDSSYQFESHVFGYCQAHEELFPLYVVGMDAIVLERCDYRNFVMDRINEKGKPTQWAMWQGNSVDSDYFGTGMQSHRQQLLIDDTKVYVGGRYSSTTLGPVQSLLRMNSLDGSIDMSYGIEGRIRSAPTADYSNYLTTPFLANAGAYVAHASVIGDGTLLTVRFFRKD